MSSSPRKRKRSSSSSSSPIYSSVSTRARTRASKAMDILHTHLPRDVLHKIFMFLDLFLLLHLLSLSSSFNYDIKLLLRNTAEIMKIGIIVHQFKNRKSRILQLPGSASRIDIKYLPSVQFSHTIEEKQFHSFFTPIFYSHTLQILDLSEINTACWRHMHVLMLLTYYNNSHSYKKPTTKPISLHHLILPSHIPHRFILPYGSEYHFPTSLRHISFTKPS